MTAIAPTAAALSTAPSTATSTTTGQGTGALGSLSSNFNTFLSLLMTQLKNQDPTSPLDTNQFTSQLVQFSGVEQQINTNTSLTQLIQLTQASEITQSSAILGKQITVQSNQIALQNGAGTLRFTAPVPANVSISVSDSSGRKLRDVTLNGGEGMNAWNWDGKDNTGRTVPDGAYAVAVTGGATGGKTAALPFAIVGTATGVTTQNNTVNLQLGAVSVPFSAVRSVGK